jgi:cytochrome d ubiquinol oxidase subunit I
MAELNNFNQIIFAFGMFLHQIISAPMFGLAFFFFISSFFGNLELNKSIQTKFLPVFIIIYSISLISGLSLDLGLNLYWEGSLLEELSTYKYGRSSLIGFIIVNAIIIVLSVFKIKDKWKPVLYFGLSIGSILLFFWSFIVNTIMQKPDLVELNQSLALINIDLTNIFSDKYFLFRILHYLNASFIQAIFILLIGLSIDYKAMGIGFYKFKKSFILVLACGFFALGTQLFSGHYNLINISEIQTSKVSAALGAYHSEKQINLYLIAATNSEKQETRGVILPSIVSKFLMRDIEIDALDTFDNEDLPNVEVVFQSFHVMILCWVLIFLFFTYFIYNIVKNKNKVPIYLIVIFSLLAILATQSGWVFSETGRKPWLFFNVLKYAPTSHSPHWYLLINNLILQIALIFIGSHLIWKKLKS